MGTVCQKAENFIIYSFHCCSHGFTKTPSTAEEKLRVTLKCRSFIMLLKYPTTNSQSRRGKKRVLYDETEGTSNISQGLVCIMPPLTDFSYFTTKGHVELHWVYYKIIKKPLSLQGGPQPTWDLWYYCTVLYKPGSMCIRDCRGGGGKIQKINVHFSTIFIFRFHNSFSNDLIRVTLCNH